MGLHFYKTLLRWRHTGAQAADAKASSPVAKIDKAFQVHRCVIFPPYSAAGAIENLLLMLKVDDKSFDPLHIEGRMCPPIVGQSRVLGLPFGNNKSVDPRYNTCLKGISSLQVETYGGPGGITGDYDVWLLGDWFEDDEAMQDFFGATEFNPETVVISDPFRAHEITIRRTTALTKDAWKNASAGSVEAPKPRILPYFTHARNLLATTVNKEYPFDIRLGSVAEDWESLYWDMTDMANAIYINYLGVLPHDNLLNTWVEIGGDEYPRDRWITEYHANELPLPYLPTDEQAYRGPRHVGEEMALLIYGEAGDVRIIDNGTSIPIRGVTIGLWARRIELR